MWSGRTRLMRARRPRRAAAARSGRRLAGYNFRGHKTETRGRRPQARRSARPRRRCCGRAGPSRRRGGRGRFALRAFWAFFAGLVVEGFCRWKTDGGDRRVVERHLRLGAGVRGLRKCKRCVRRFRGGAGVELSEPACAKCIPARNLRRVNTAIRYAIDPHISPDRRALRNAARRGLSGLITRDLDILCTIS